METLAIELSPKCQMQDWIYYLVVQSKSRRFIEHIIWNPLIKNYKYSKSSISLMHYLKDIKYCNLFIP
jgi:hypothetical protein